MLCVLHSSCDLLLRLSLATHFLWRGRKFLLVGEIFFLEIFPSIALLPFLFQFLFPNSHYFLKTLVFLNYFYEIIFFFFNVKKRMMKIILEKESIYILYIHFN